MMTLLIVNVDKTVSIIFNGKKNLSDDISFTLNVRVLSRVLKYKYLGCILSTDLSKILNEILNLLIRVLDLS